MTLSSAGWHPAWYESLSVLAFILYPLFVVPLFRRAAIWRTSAPLLLVLLPLLHSITLAYLAIRNVFLSMAIDRIHQPGAAVAAGLADAHGLLKIGACFSIVALIVALFVARKNRPFPGIAKGRGLATWIIAAGLLLTGGVFAIAFAILGGTNALRWNMLHLVHPGAIASGVLSVFAIGAAIWLTRSARELPANGSHEPVLGITLAIPAIIGTVAWLVQNWLWDIARTGF
ncbi:MAG TPA: hypothetical protein VF787_28110 [Thermoanaerobaculia bacterium]